MLLSIDKSAIKHEQIKPNFLKVTPLEKANHEVISNLFHLHASTDKFSKILSFS